MSWSVQTLGTLVGPIRAGFLYDLTRSYAIGFGIFSIASLGAAALMLSARRPQSVSS